MTQSSAAFHKAGLYSNSASFKWSSPSEIARAYGKSRVRGGATTWPNLAAVAVCGGMQKRNLTTRAGVQLQGPGGLTTVTPARLADWPRA